MSTATELPQEYVDDAVVLWHETGLTRPWNDPRADLHRALTGPSSTVLAMHTPDDGLLGTVMVGSDGHRGWVYYLAVQPRLQGTGLGRTLMRAAEVWLRERGVVKLNVMVRNSNVHVRTFYRSLGYEDSEVAVLGRFIGD